jgi:3-methyladenine DNA glycosylase AlkD
MKFFTFDEDLDRQVKQIRSRIRLLMNGEVAQQLRDSGLDYPKMYGVSLIHLRKLSQELQASNALADRLWNLEFRETRILATMLAKRDELSDVLLAEWADGVSNLELAEQMAFNLLGRRPGSRTIFDTWLLDSQLYVRYAALMSVGWQFRFVGNDLAPWVKQNLPTMEGLITETKLVHPVSHCLKMAGRFDAELRPAIVHFAKGWTGSDAKVLQEAGQGILFELEEVE